ncbi:hypothetical protein H0H93_010351 [Arthromyces matolae]|nr:hypothetical protein H0H93_010351 [Arthromyces matolae]
MAPNAKKTPKQNTNEIARMMNEALQNNGELIPLSAGPTLRSGRSVGRSATPISFGTATTGLVSASAAVASTPDASPADALTVDPSNVDPVTADELSKAKGFSTLADPKRPGINQGETVMMPRNRFRHYRSMDHVKGNSNRLDNKIFNMQMLGSTKYRGSEFKPDSLVSADKHYFDLVDGIIPEKLKLTKEERKAAKVAVENWRSAVNKGNQYVVLARLTPEGMAALGITGGHCGCECCGLEGGALPVQNPARGRGASGAKREQRRKKPVFKTKTRSKDKTDKMTRSVNKQRAYELKTKAAHRLGDGDLVFVRFEPYLVPETVTEEDLLQTGPKPVFNYQIMVYGTSCLSVEEGSTLTRIHYDPALEAFTPKFIVHWTVELPQYQQVLSTLTDCHYICHREDWETRGTFAKCVEDVLSKAPPKFDHKKLEDYFCCAHPFVINSVLSEEGLVPTDRNGEEAEGEEMELDG